MRKTFTLAICLMASMASFAQTTANSFAFVDAGGNTVADGAVLTRTEITEDPIESYISSGLFVKNVSDANAYLKIETAISQLPDGSEHSICYPGGCVRTGKAGTSESPEMGGEKSGATNSMQTEWFPNGKYGTCTVTYTIKEYSYDGMEPNNNGIFVPTYSLKGSGPSVTINYVNADPAGIDGTEAETAAAGTVYYDLQGRSVAQPGKGLYIKKVKTAGGSAKTVKTVVR